ncbi:NADH-quinone oxidoreductase subunit C [Coprothermobacter platensis]|uniref:NADH-quinone oxidoreductase subunit C n=1 Tax=Coprothermobacter platensis TaxID=108819 RepID=UPI000364D0DD|nr:NADH-quinone oxidoreductase subunit C [Coprothermobacter platensis]
MIEAKEITLDNLLSEVKNYHDNGYRLVTTTCMEVDDDKLEILYHFDKDFKLENLRLTVDKNQTIPSISSIYFCAVLSENEMQDMFGLKIDGMVVDYGGKFLLGEDSPLSPMAHIQIVAKEQGENKEGGNNA